MARFTIIGAGQSGLLIAHGLLGDGHEVTLVSNRTPEQIQGGQVTSSQAMFGTACTIEQDLGLNHWDEVVPAIEGIAFSMPDPDRPGQKALEFSARFDRPGQAVDQRIKFPRLMDDFVKLGGTLVLEEAGIDDLERYAAESDLVIVAAGKSEITRIFERDIEKSPYEVPQRNVALTYVHGLLPRDEFSAVGLNRVPGVGECGVYAGYTLSGACDIFVHGAVPGGPIDLFRPGMKPEDHLETTLTILKQFMPWEYERAQNVTLTDDKAVLAGAVTPTVRKPVATLPSGRKVLGAADVVVLNDPATAQGSNNAAKCAESYLSSIRSHSGAFDEAFMRRTFDTFWAQTAQFSTQFTNAMLAPPPPFAVEALMAAADYPQIAHRFVNGFDDPADFFRWFMDPGLSAQFLAEVRANG